MDTLDPDDTLVVPLQAFPDDLHVLRAAAMDEWIGGPAWIEESRRLAAEGRDRWEMLLDERSTEATET